MARFFGVPVEGELGVIPLARDQKADDFEFQGVTNPEAAEQFAKQTGIHTLAPSVGTAHGVYVKLPKIHFAVLEEIRKRTQIPLVLHGGSGVPVEYVRRCISLGVAKVNVGTDLRRTFVDRVAEGGSRPYIEAAEILAEARSRVEDVVSRWIEVLGSASLLS
jgi:fructose/tagatose bisphosphate aldolase